MTRSVMVMAASRAVAGKAPHVRPVTASDLGLHTVPLGLLATHAALAIVVMASCRFVGLSVGGGAGGWLSQLGPTAMLLVLWLAHYVQPGRKRSEWWIAEAALGLLLLGLGTTILASGQYAAAALNRPLVDSSLAAADTQVGISVPDLVAWTRAHPWAQRVMYLAYYSLVPQVVLMIGVVWWTRDRHALWEYVVTYHICAFVTVVASAMWPVAGAFTYYGFTSTLNQTRFIEHFHGLRDGTMTVVPFGNIEGLISMPSFHVIGALLLTSAVRRTRLLAPVGILNGLLIVSTVMTGAHYAIDVFGGLIVWGAAILLHRRYVAHLVPDFTEPDRLAASTAGFEIGPLGQGAHHYGPVRAAGATYPAAQ